jgi:hypothetical protein
MNIKTITCVVLAAGLMGCQATSKQDISKTNIGEISVENALNFELIDRCLYGWTNSLVSDKQSKSNVLSLTEELAVTKEKLKNLQEENNALKQHIENDRLKREKAYAAFRQEWCSISDEGEQCTIE